jgi:hypothetical protein
MQEFLVDAFLRQHAAPPQRIVLDFDATDDPVHGDQLGRFFHGYYREFCYLPLYVFCGDHPLLALLRPAPSRTWRGSSAGFGRSGRSSLDDARTLYEAEYCARGSAS